MTHSVSHKVLYALFQFSPHSYLFSHSIPDGCPRHRVSANRAEDGPVGHLSVTFLTDNVTVETLVDVAGLKAGAHWTFVDILHAFRSGRPYQRLPFCEDQGTKWDVFCKYNS